MESMFERCGSLSSLDLCNFNTSGVTSMEYMFYDCGSLQNLDISKFDTSRVSNMMSNNASYKIIKWSSNDDSTVSVNTGGMIRAHKAGEATITATTEDGGKTATCHVTVNKSPSPGPRPTPTPPVITIIPVTGITVSPTVQTLVIGDEFIITPTITPDNATDKSITWSVSDESVASVDSNGNVTALNSGSTTVTAKTKDGGYTAICIVTVVEPVSVFRLYNPNSGEHFFTTDDEELEYLNSIGWINEGYAWSSPTSSSIPIYRLYNPNATGAGAHHFTFNTYERDDLVALGWRYEGIGWCGV